MIGGLTEFKDERKNLTAAGRRLGRRKTPLPRWLAEKWKEREKKDEKWSWNMKKSHKNERNYHPPSKTYSLCRKTPRRHQKKPGPKHSLQAPIEGELHGFVKENKCKTEMKKLYGKARPNGCVGVERKKWKRGEEGRWPTHFCEWEEQESENFKREGKEGVFGWVEWGGVMIIHSPNVS